MKLGKARLLSCAAVLLVVALAQVAAAAPDKETAELIKRAGGLKEYPEANALVIRAQSNYDVNENGTYVNRVHLLAKILTDKGFDDYGEIKVPFYKTYDSVIVVTARVIKQDGEIVDVPRDQMKDISSATTEAMNIYESDALERVVPFKNLEVGDCIELVYEDHLFHAFMDGQFDGLDVFQAFDPIIHKETNVIIPQSMNLRHVVRNGEVKYAKKQAGDKVRHTWSVEDMPRIVSEPAMPPLIEVAPTVVFSTIDSWETISKWWNDMAGKQMTMNDALRAEVAALTNDKFSKEDKINAIYHYAAQKIRYMGLGTGKKKGLEPKPATETFETKYGVCRDIATLMVAMLREANIESEVVLTNMGAEVEYGIPYVGFNHAIVAIKNDDGGYTYADPTVDNSVDWLPAIESNQQVLVCTPQGKTLADTPLTPAKENLGKVRAQSILSENGTFTSEVSIVTDGIYDLALRQWAQSIPTAQMSMIWNYVLQQVYPGTRLTGFEHSETEDMTLPFTIKFSYRVDNYPTNAGEFVLMKSPVSMGAFELVSKFLLGAASLPERKYPFELGFTFGAEEEETITLPPGMKLRSMPDPVAISKGPVDYKMTYVSSQSQELESGATQVTYKKEFMINQTKMSPEEYAQFKAVMKAASKSERGELIMKREGAGN